MSYEWHVVVDNHTSFTDIFSTRCSCRPAWVQRLPFLSCRLFVKAAVQIVLLCYCMFIKLPRPDTVLVQNPPAIPTLVLCVMVCWWHGAKLVIDWHNFGYTIMSLTMGRRHPLVSQNLLTSKVLGCLCPAHHNPAQLCRYWQRLEYINKSRLAQRTARRLPQGIYTYT